MPFLEFDVEIHTVICTNAAGSINALRQAVRARGHRWPDRFSTPSGRLVDAGGLVLEDRP